MSEAQQEQEQQQQSDFLQQIIDRQLFFEERMGTMVWDDKYNKQNIVYLNQEILKSCIAMGAEVEELKALTNWKWWKVYPSNNPDQETIEKMKEETIDILHFVLRTLVCLGLTSASDITNLYLSKNRINHQRFDRELVRTKQII